jgi:hypothetical protein
MSVTINKSITPSEFLLVLWKGTKTLGMGSLCKKKPTLQDAEDNLIKSNCVDYFFGRPIKTSFQSHPVYETSLYDINAGNGRMQKIVEMLNGEEVTVDLLEENVQLTETEKQIIIEKCTKGFNIVDMLNDEKVSVKENVDLTDTKNSSWKNVLSTGEWKVKKSVAQSPQRLKCLQTASFLRGVTVSSIDK